MGRRIARPIASRHGDTCAPVQTGAIPDPAPIAGRCHARPGFGLAGDRGGVRDASTERSDQRAGPIAKRASAMRSMTEKEARDPRAWEWAAAQPPPAQPACPCCVRDGSPSRGETPAPRWLDAQRDSPAPRSGGRPDRQSAGSHSTTSPATTTRSTCCTRNPNPASSGSVRRVKPWVRHTPDQIHLHHASGDQPGQGPLDHLLRCNGPPGKTSATAPATPAGSATRRPVSSGRHQPPCGGR